MEGLWWRISCVGSLVDGLRCRVSGVASLVDSVRCRVSGEQSLVEGLGWRVSGGGCQVCLSYRVSLRYTLYYIFIYCIYIAE